MRKLLIIIMIVMANAVFAQSVMKLKFTNDTAVINFDTESVTWKKSQKTNTIIPLNDKGSKWQEVVFKQNSTVIIGTFVFLNEKGTKGYYINEKTKKKETFVKLQ